MFWVQQAKRKVFWIIGRTVLETVPTRKRRENFLFFVGRDSPGLSFPHALGGNPGGSHGSPTKDFGDDSFMEARNDI